MTNPLKNRESSPYMFANTAGQELPGPGGGGKPRNGAAKMTNCERMEIAAMGKTVRIEENGLNLVFELEKGKRARFLYFSPVPYRGGAVPESLKNGFKLVDLAESGMDNTDHHGMKHTGTVPGALLRYRSMKDTRNALGRKLEITQETDGLFVTSHIQFYDGVRAVRSWTELENKGTRTRELEYVTSFAYYGASLPGSKPWEEKMLVRKAHNSWYDEARWQAYTLPQMGLNPIDMMASTKRIYAYNAGTWSSEEYLPMGSLENTDAGVCYLWQIENNGSWYWEVGDSAGDFLPDPETRDMVITTEGTARAEIYFQLCGPTEQECQWHKSLKPGERFVTVPVAVSAVRGSFETSADEMIRYRRRIRRKNEDNEKLGVIFNDYMNCLFGDSTTEKLIPLIDAAAEAGCEYFCIDCGWYTDENWWGRVGEWKPSEKRYPGGIEIPIRYIRSKGMIPGLWLEIEVMGRDAPLAKKLPKDWFFVRHGRPVSDTGRYQLDFRNPEVRAYATKTVDRMVREYGVGYIKMDYNINGGVGTELHADSFGDGLLEHDRAYLKWLDGIFAKYPGLVIENCGSGGMRMDYAMLSRHSIQSSSDQTDYMKNAAIAVSSPVGVNPEQCAIWSYPLRTGDREEVVVNMVNAMLLRIHQSGHLAELSPERFHLVKEGIACYKSIRADIKDSLPFWPLGLPSFYEDWLALGLGCGRKLYLAVWRVRGGETAEIPLPQVKGKKAEVRVLYPSFETETPVLDTAKGTLRVHRKAAKTARLYEIDLSEEP